ncbi:gliding motility-associated C-terminal domain-containing protein [Dyadobacter sp. NIV53]|uniref:T9SS type B sorting domain-containing protein n=1 Tax=Dyadobacter sp. NIV53 TaxID=2861765 RepID=UPI001C87B0CB|nr:gliding motility-associated C-terminal domain-containing protein [Dyadobacter sp. NIV53]
MKSRVLLFFIFAWFSVIEVNAQAVKHTYRFYGNFSVALPQCGPDLTQAQPLGNCPSAPTPGDFIEDALPCGAKRQVYHNNLNWGLAYPNTTGVIKGTYTIQMYVRVTDWGKEWSRIIDFSIGKADEGIYFKNTAGSEERCLDFYPFGIVGSCPYFNSSTYYLLTFTRNGLTGIFDVYVNNTLFASYNDTRGMYVGKAGVPIYIFRDDAATACDSGEANFAYLSFTDQYSTQSNVEAVAEQICYTASINATADFAINPNPSCGYPANVNVIYTGDIEAPGTGYIFDWDWDGGTVVSGTGMGPFVVNWNTPGTKDITLVVTNTSCNKTLTNKKPANISSLDLVTSLDAGACTNTDEATITVTAINGVSPYEYSIDSVNYQKETEFKVTPATYRVYVKDGEGCISIKEVTVDSLDITAVQTIGDTVICEGQQVKLLTTSNATAFSWFPGTGLDNSSAVSPIAAPTVTTQYIVTATKNNCPVQDTVTITVVPDIEVIVTPDTEIQPGIPFQLSASSPQLDGQAGVIYIWMPPTGLDNPAIENPVATILSSKTYVIKITSPDGCAGTSQVNLNVIPPPSIFVPSAFTPNGDGKNEILRLVTNKITALNYFQIYNRWGEVVFYSNQLDQGWDGRFKTAEPVAGHYVFKLEGITEEGKTIKKEGTVLLIR